MLTPLAALTAPPTLPRAAAALARGVVLGIGAAAPIGPVNVEIARRTLRRGFAAGFALGCGAMSADITYAAVGALSVSRLLTRPAPAAAIGAAGAGLLGWLAFACFRAAVRDARIDPLASADPGDDRMPSGLAGPGRGYLAGLLMTLLNPLTLAFWFVVVPAAAGPVAGNRMKEPTGAVPITCAGVFIGTLGWVIVFCGLLAWAGRRRRRWHLAAADVVGGVALAGFAALAAWRVAKWLL